ncbi:16624_t:CDS:2 [Entrophospora sp. SA101]|nr:16624_t:CDS:2 [Entrophospora sp. SA101]
MENSTREHQRYYIFVEWKNGTSVADIHKKLIVMVDLNNPIFNEDYDDLNDNIEVEDESMEESSEEVFDFDAIPEISPPSNM